MNATPQRFFGGSEPCEQLFQRKSIAHDEEIDVASGTIAAFRSGRSHAPRVFAPFSHLQYADDQTVARSFQYARSAAGTGALSGAEPVRMHALARIAMKSVNDC